MVKIWLVVLFINADGDLQKQSYSANNMESCLTIATYVRSILQETIPFKAEVDCKAVPN